MFALFWVMHYKMQGEIGDALAFENIQCQMTSNVKQKLKKLTVLTLSFIKLVKYKKRH